MLTFKLFLIKFLRRILTVQNLVVFLVAAIITFFLASSFDISVERVLFGSVLIGTVAVFFVNFIGLPKFF